MRIVLIFGESTEYLDRDTLKLFGSKASSPVTGKPHIYDITWKQACISMITFSKFSFQKTIANYAQNYHFFNIMHLYMHIYGCIGLKKRDKGK
jgi:hypothetical protein